MEGLAEIIPGLSFTLIAFVAALSVVVFVHEMGHFWVARRNGVRCDVFSIGFGPELFGFTDRHGTRWRVAALPLGGYVKMFGEAEGANPGEEGDAPRPMTPEEQAVSFKYKTIGQRAAIVAAGPVANLVFAIFVMFAVFWALGQPRTEAVIGTVLEDSAAAEAGLLPGDRITALNDTEIVRFEDLQRLIPLGHGTEVVLTVDRDGRELHLPVTPRIVEDEDPFGNIQRRALLGVAAAPGARTIAPLGPVEALGAAFAQTWNIAHGTYVVMGQILTGKRGGEEIGGPIRIAEVSGQAARMGVINFILFMALLSVNLGLINLLPVPLLDGGHLLFYACEAARGRPLSERVQEWGLKLGLVLVLALMIYVTRNDILHIVNRLT